MSSKSRMSLCIVCNQPFADGDEYHVEPVIEMDQPIQYFPVHDGEHLVHSWEVK